jgi:signal transduction histidine kinase
MPPDTRQRIFEPFFTTKSGGMGLGLPIAKRSIELHGGSISVDCPPEDGTKMTIEIPAPTGEEPR